MPQTKALLDFLVTAYCKSDYLIIACIITAVHLLIGNYYYPLEYLKANLYFIFVGDINNISLIT